ncbi:hypothetical protein [Streptomyces decoyicus]|uniref:hypothetical protein n=1 Tax=Streptomyces decoyicus TaxID=249567 RepID=UPI00386B815E|nr:hypothetical protein OG532_00590 [Streptomyces decoyicus]
MSRSPAEIRLERRRRARLHRDPHGPQYTPEEGALKERNDAVFMERLDAGPPWPAESPVPMLPVAQLYLRDIPMLRPPGQADLLQVLEDEAAAFAAGHVAGQNPAQPTAVEVGSTDNLQLYVCPASPEHPHTDLIQ